MENFQEIISERNIVTTENRDNIPFIELNGNYKSCTKQKHQVQKNEHSDKTYQALEVIVEGIESNYQENLARKSENEAIVE